MIMKKIIYVLIILVCGCSEESHQAFGSDEDPPGKVIINSTENVAGGAIIKFSPPSDEDLLYISGKYENEKGEKKEVIVSAYIDSLNINGFGKIGTFDVEVSAFDLGNNQSEIEMVEISPLEAPIHEILRSINGSQDFGGINVSYQNPSGANVSLNMSVLNGSGELEFKESFYTSQKNSSYSFRGYDPVATTFVIYVEDQWGNQTETKSFEITPLKDVFIEKSFWSVVTMPGDENFSEYGFSANQIWDGSWSNQWNCGHTNFLPLPHQLTLDLGQRVKLNRFKLYQRGGSELYKHGNPKVFEVYGRENLDNLPIYDTKSPGDGWTLLGKFESFKPSGLPPGSNTEEDYLFQDNGEDFVFTSESQSKVIRYIRFVNIESWNNQMVTVIGELSFWGGIMD